MKEQTQVKQAKPVFINLSAEAQFRYQGQNLVYFSADKRSIGFKTFGDDTYTVFFKMPDEATFNSAQNVVLTLLYSDKSRFLHTHNAVIACDLIHSIVLVPSGYIFVCNTNTQEPLTVIDVSNLDKAEQQSTVDMLCAFAINNLAFAYFEGYGVMRKSEQGHRIPVDNGVFVTNARGQKVFWFEVTDTLTKDNIIRLLNEKLGSTQIMEVANE